jgi:hypothetical protein
MLNKKKQHSILQFFLAYPLGELVMADHGLGDVPGSDVTEWSQNGLCILSLADGLALIFLKNEIS